MGKIEKIVKLKNWLKLKQGDIIYSRKTLMPRKVIFANSVGCIALMKLRVSGKYPNNLYTTYVPIDRHNFILPEGKCESKDSHLLLEAREKYIKMSKKKEKEPTATITIEPITEIVITQEKIMSILAEQADEAIKDMFRYSYNNPLKTALEDAEVKSEIQKMVKKVVFEIVKSDTFADAIREKILARGLKNYLD